MKIGVCVGADRLSEAKAAKSDYAELALAPVAAMSECDFQQLLSDLKENNIKCETMNILFPGRDIPLVGEDADMQAVGRYLDTALERAAELGAEILVFGSGAARNCPEGYPAEKAEQQLIDVIRLAAEKAGEYGITVALEPLRKAETNMINSVDDAVRFVKAAGVTAGVTADLFHMMTEGESCEGIIRGKEYIVHTHIASKGDRMCPQKNDGNDYAPFFDALKCIGYNGRLSVEGGFDEDNCPLADGLEYLKELI